MKKRPTTREEATKEIIEIIKNHTELTKGGWPVVWYPEDKKD
jgi:hypothetical protein